MTNRRRAVLPSRAAVAAAVLAAVGCSAARAGPKPQPEPGKDPASYVRKATWVETMVASREALMRQEAEAAAEGGGDQPPPSAPSTPAATAGKAAKAAKTPSAKPAAKPKAARKGPEAKDRQAIWLLVARDFAEPDQRSQQQDEQSFWSKDWPPGKLSEVARRYAGASAVTVRPQAQKLAASAATVQDLGAVIALYRQHRGLNETLALLGEVNPEAMRRAIRDLGQSFGQTYPRWQEDLKRVDEVEKDLPAVLSGVGKGDSDAIRKGLDIVAFQREALLSNPLLDFDKLLLVRRGAGNLGLVNNWLSNSSLPHDGFDNDVAVLSPVRPAGELKTLYRPSGGAFVGDVDLNFDADRLLFSMSGPLTWQVYEVRADGTGLRQLTPGDQKDVDNYDACYLPDGRIAFTSTANMQGVPCIGGGGHVANLALLEPDTRKVRMLAFEQDHDWCPTVMNDGRIMYLRWEYTDTPHYYSRLMFSMNPDGTNQRAIYGSNSYWPNALFFARPIPGHPTQFVGVIGGHHDVPRMGELILFDPARGAYEADGAVQRIPGCGKEVKPIIRDGLVGGSWPLFLHPYPLSDKYFLVSRPVGRNRNGPWGVYLVDVFDNMVLIKSQPGYALLEPIPLRKTPRLRIIPDKVDLSRKDAVVYVTDVYAGPGLKGIPRGSVKKLRLFTYTFGYRGMGGHNCFGVESGWDAKRILGTVPVEPDGSAYFRVPANTPISLQPLDETGAAVQLMRSWLTAMPGETLACVGCHEDPKDAPINYQTLATRRGAAEIAPWRGPVRGMGFPREVQPVLDKYCVACHSGARKDIPDFADVSRGWRGYARSYHALHRYIRRPGPESDYHMLQPMEYHISTSELVQILTKGHHNVVLDAEAWDRLCTWIDLNVPYHATWSESRGGRIGTVAQRYRELQKLYAGVEDDPEAMPPLPTERPRPVVPPPEQPVAAQAMRVAGWPFDAAAARRRQEDAAQGLSRQAGATRDEEAGGTPAPQGVLGAVGASPSASPAPAPAQGPPSARTIPVGTMPERFDPIAGKAVPARPVDLKLVLIPAGEFIMGDARGCRDEQPAAPVRIEKPFWMGVVEITNAQYAVFDPRHDSRYIDQELKDQETPGYPVNQPDQPVIRVSWQEAMAFCRWLNERTGLRFTLPTEAQWEWACRAGTATAMWYGPAEADFAAFANLADTNMKRFALEGFRPKIAVNAPPEHAFIPRVDSVDDGRQVSAPVGGYRPNPWGLHDMHGNVWEWTLSSYRAYPYNGLDGQDRPEAVGRKVVRGGSWFDRPSRARSAFRLAYQPYQKVFNVGFRVVAEAR